LRSSILLLRVRLATHVSSKEDHREHYAKGAHNNVGDCQEIVLTTEGVSC